MSGYFEITPTSDSQFIFNLKSGNHQVILTSERYTSKQAAEGGIASVQKNSPDDARYQRRLAKDKSPYFVLVAANGETIGSSEMYSSASAMEDGVASVRANGAGAPIKDLTTA